MSTISAASLNFSGINTNPFQYDDGTPLFQSLNKNFLHIKQTQFPHIDKWAGAILDKHFKNNRFTVLFGNELLQNIGEKLPSEEEFKLKWYHYFEDALANKKIGSNYQAKPQEIEDVYTMDFSFYRAIVMTIYGYSSLKQYNQKAVNEDTTKLTDFLRQKRASPPFQLSNKKQLVQKYLHTLDLLFLQQAGSVEWQKTQGYTIAINHDSLVAYKTSVFGQINQKETKKWQNLLDINNDSALVITQKGFLLLSSHFKSSLPFYKQQQAELYKVLNYVIDYYDASPYKIIVGVDANHRIESPKINQQNYIVPNKPEDSSSIKKRSYIQAQMHKADQAVDELKDHIISTLEIQRYSLELVDGSASQKELLPNDKHPYDHFIVRAKLIIQ